MASSITITAKTGPAKTVTSLVITSPREFKLNFDTATLQITEQDGTIKEFDVKAVSTVTVTASTGTFTITIS